MKLENGCWLLLVDAENAFIKLNRKVSQKILKTKSDFFQQDD